MKQIPASLLTLTAGIVITLFSLWYGQNHGLLPEQASEQAPLVDSLFNLMMTIGTALFIVVEGAIVIFLFRFRQRKGDMTDGLPIEGNLPLEAFWTAIPAVIVIGVGVYSFNVFQEMGGFSPGSHSMAMMGQHQHGGTLVAQAPGGTSAMPLMASADGSVDFDPAYGFGAGPEGAGQEADVVVNVTGMQYAWLFNYPDNSIITGELHIPVGKSVQLNLSAQDVIHSFWVPQFRLKQDALPGQDTGLRFVATKEGQYPVVCAELCGSYHGGMRSQVIVHSQADYDTWLADNSPASSSADSVAVLPTSAMTPQQYLAPLSQELGIDAPMLHAMSESAS